MPSQKFGSESPRRPKLRAARSSIEFGRRAETIPSGRPTSSATRAAARASSSGDGQAAGDLADDRLARAERVAGVTPQQGAEPAEVLEGERPVEAEVAAQLRHLLRGQHGARAEADRDRVAGDQPEEEERQQRHADQRRPEREEPAQEVARHDGVRLGFRHSAAAP